MLLLFCSTIFLLTTFLGWGKVTEYVLGENIEGTAGKILTGIFALGILFTVSSFFLPLNVYFEIPLIIIGIVFFFLKRIYLNFYSFSGKNQIVLGSISAVALFCGAFNPFILDHFGYYVPTIKWLTEYGLVKGISNLDLILGQMSVWHIFQAGFSNFSDPFLKLNAILLVVYGIYIVENRSWIQLIFIPVLFIFTQSPSPDLPVIVFSLIILNEILKGNKNLSFLLAFSVFTFTIKPTVIWLPLFVLLYSVFVAKFKFSNLVLAFSIFVLFIFKNLWTFGYPVFPVSSFDFGIPWKPNTELLKSSSEYAITKTFDEQYTIKEIQQFSPADYIKNWLFLKGIKSIINISFVILLLGFSIFAIVKKQKIFTLLCIAILVKSILVLLFSAQYRFFIDVFFAVIFVAAFNLMKRKTAVYISSVMTIFAMIIFSFPKVLQQLIPSFQLGKYMAPFEKKQLLSPSHYEYGQYHSYKLGELDFQVSKHYPFNFNTPVPAISESFVFDYAKAGIFPQPIDKNNLKKGFVWKKLNKEEQKQLEKTLKDIKSHYK